ncbi:hypothetical protein FHU38_003575 [Saccharomonospora amisosensis]|uniref:Uncharacterized protein n=1 Tax=Saccharomonospora amisosensis TaxID=1128677 RepID=A0A7X5US65_9PSEU|nr:hypothetical protein [Saccharomonospora amisosensis]NIJ13231.1 hypothetical protein [Saccharomonospora amisosensis]
MTENHDLVPDADADEQREPVGGGDEGDVDRAGMRVPFEANPADVAEQAVPVPLDEEDENRPAT